MRIATTNTAPAVLRIIHITMRTPRVYLLVLLICCLTLIITTSASEVREDRILLKSHSPAVAPSPSQATIDVASIDANTPTNVDTNVTPSIADVASVEMPRAFDAVPPSNSADDVPSTGRELGVAFTNTDTDLQQGYQGNHKRRYWTVYWVFNFICCALCGGLMIVVYQNPRRTTNDVLVASLCFALLFHGISCGLQCFFSMIFDRFVSGMTGCYVEALIHMIAFDAIMGNLALISFDSRRTVQTGRSIGIKRVLQFEAAIYILSTVTMCLFAIGSPIYMTPSGLFCFFSWTSPLMYAAFLPLFVATLVILMVNYAIIFRITSRTIASLGTTSSSLVLQRRVDQMRLAQKLFGFVLIFAIGFGVFTSGILVAVILGSNNMYDLDAIGGVFIILHGCIVPVTYGLINRRIRTPLLRVLTLGLYHGVEESQSDKEITSAKDSSEGISMTAGGGLKSPSRRVSSNGNGTATRESNGSAGISRPVSAGKVTLAHASATTVHPGSAPQFRAKLKLEGSTTQQARGSITMEQAPTHQNHQRSLGGDQATVDALAAIEQSPEESMVTQEGPLDSMAASPQASRRHSLRGTTASPTAETTPAIFSSSSAGPMSPSIMDLTTPPIASPPSSPSPDNMQFHQQQQQPQQPHLHQHQHQPDEETIYEDEEEVHTTIITVEP